MKKLISFVLAICACLSLCVMLSSCGGEKNAWQTYLKQCGNKEFDIEKTTGKEEEDRVSEYYNLDAKMKTTYEAKLYVDIKETEQVPNDFDAGVEAYRVDKNIKLYYNMRDTVLTVSVYGYTYRTEAVIDVEDEDYEWKDGYATSTLTSNTDPIKFKFDINKYFENGKLTADDALEPFVLSESNLARNEKGLTTTKYTERNPDWDKDALADILETVNVVLDEVDDIIAKDSK